MKTFPACLIFLIGLCAFSANADEKDHVAVVAQGGIVNPVPSGSTACVVSLGASSRTGEPRRCKARWSRDKFVAISAMFLEG